MFQGRIKARQKKMQHIARLLEIPGQSGPPSPAYAGTAPYGNRSIGRGNRESRPSFYNMRVPGFATPRYDNVLGVVHRTDVERRGGKESGEGTSKSIVGNRSNSSGAIRREARSRESSGSRMKSREGSPRMPRPRSEEIPLELIKKVPNSTVDAVPKVSSVVSRPQAAREDDVPTANATEANSNGSVIQAAASEETSFIANKKNEKKRGMVETI